MWRNDEMIALPPKPLAVLIYLVQHAGQLVLKETLLDAIWPDSVVSDAVLKTCMSQIRKALGDTAQSPQYVATVHRQGYRFIASVTSFELPSSNAMAAMDMDMKSSSGPPSRASNSHPTSDAPDPLIEREAVFAYLHNRLRQASQGQRQVVFVSGEAGIGKTSVVEAFVTQAMRDRQMLWAFGQCVQHYSAGEAYLSILEALGRLCRGPKGNRIISLMSRYAPTWLLQMPWLLSPSALTRMQQEIHGVTRERMLRELAEVLEAVSTEYLLVLVVEDLHWSDYATLDAITMLARRQERAKLLLLGTYRPVETIVHEHPLRAVIQNLRVHGHGAEYTLDLLSERGVMAYLSAHFPQHQFPEPLSQVLHRRTEGNPLFLVTMTASLLRQGVIGRQDGQWVLQSTIQEVESHVPEGLRFLIEQQLDDLSTYDQLLLAAGSAIGVEFSVAAVAAAAVEDPEQVEARCEQLSRQQRFLRPAGLDIWPDGTVTALYRFAHSLYQQVAYQRMGAGQRVQLHRRLSARLEIAYGEQIHQIAAELARHATQGREIDRAIHFLLHTAENAVRRYALHDAREPLATGLELLSTLPSTPHRTQQELSYLMLLRVVLAATQGLDAPDMMPLLSRMAELYPQVETLSPFIMGFWMGIWAWHLQHLESLRTAEEVAARYLSLAQDQQSQQHIMRASQALGTSLLVLGSPALARQHLERAIAIYDPVQHNPTKMEVTQDPGVTNLCLTAVMLWLLGYPDQALQRCQEAMALAQQLQHPFSLVFALRHMARLHLYRGEYRQMQSPAEALIKLATEQAFHPSIREGSRLCGHSLIFQGKIDTGIHQISQLRMTNSSTASSTFRVRALTELADAYRCAGQTEASLDCIHEGLGMVRQADGHYHEAELHRLQGEVLLQQRPPNEQGPELCFIRALELARRQEAKMWELHTSVSLGRLWQAQDKREAARELLTPVYHGFTEGFDTLILQEAKSLLDDLEAKG
ncbi:AAA family ATPase [Candidatus Entotheonella palauensis]|uniref:AAA family ATPase n=1 Tax=Candidatus Entotheonella palauensis TaxID=93172 RepID=UPI0015C4DB0E|nr:AAA family ATPase [Candidatus Entotheonella palauensis]